MPRLPRATTITAVTLFATSSLVACGGGLSKEEASRAFAAMNGQLSAGQARAQTNPNGLTSADQASQSFDVDMQAACPEGGSMALVGSMNAYETQYTFDFTSTFVACAVVAITIDGDITYSLDLGGNGVSNLTYDFAYQGNLTFSGDIDGECEIDIASSGTATGMTYSGTMCGYQANEVVAAN